MSVGTGSLAASANYAGYLAGALLATKIPAHTASASAAATGSCHDAGVAWLLPRASEDGRGARGSRPPIWRRRGRGGRARRACTARPGCRCRSTRASRTCTTASARGGRGSPRTLDDYSDAAIRGLSQEDRLGKIQNHTRELLADLGLRCVGRVAPADRGARHCKSIRNSKF